MHRREVWIEFDCLLILHDGLIDTPPRHENIGFDSTHDHGKRIEFACATNLSQRLFEIASSPRGTRQATGALSGNLG